MSYSLKFWLNPINTKIKKKFVFQNRKFVFPGKKLPYENLEKKSQIFFGKSEKIWTENVQWVGIIIISQIGLVGLGPRFKICDDFVSNFPQFYVELLVILCRTSCSLLLNL